ncbi:alpha-glucan family phosphorylase [candidate division KSB1 bacterium]|nr:alpha-glucan family phosphorylase [candidate division KSB1 bacterium]
MKVKPLATFDVIPTLPDAISGLRTLAYNFVWTWNPEYGALFRALDSGLWEHVGHNPARMLQEISQVGLNEAARDPGFLGEYHRCLGTLERYMNDPTWFEKICPICRQREIVYFSMEYGISECLPVYSGGLGVLSGDHLKSSSDLGLPLVGVGLAYRQGYFQQQLTGDGYQTELYPENDFDRLPLLPLTDEQGNRVRVSVQFPGRTVWIQGWKVQVGRVPLYLLDTDVAENDAADRRITHTLYGGDKETRIQQELVLGFGGVALVSALGIPTTVCHMNEGHSAFIQLARIIRARKEQGLATVEATQLISAGTVFTTHTPVPAGIDQFPPDLMDKYFSSSLPALGMKREELQALGSKLPGQTGQLFNMAILALRTADYTNAVSRLHADVSRRLWEESWPNLPYDEIPIDYVTNGIHVRTWVSAEMSQLFDKVLGPEWKQSPDHKQAWEKVPEIPDADLWRVREQNRARLVDYCRRRVAEYRARTSPVEPRESELNDLLDPHALTIGFARRFATYKRATLLLRYPDRLLALLRDAARPVQFVFAGKAHPQDEAGKALIRDLIYFARAEKVEHRLIFLENYDMGVARMLVQGVDIWLNTPRRPLEASGTSGMKVLANGGLNLSILDGWWDEGYDPKVGWAIGRGKTVSDEKLQDDRDAQSLFETIEQSVVPLFYTRDDRALPAQWISKVKHSIIDLVPRFNTSRMIKEYAEDFYIPALDRAHKLAQDGRESLTAFAKWRAELQRHWSAVRVSRVAFQPTANGKVGFTVDVQADIELGGLSPEDVEVQAYYGPIRPDGSLQLLGCVALEPKSGGKYAGRVSVGESGRFGYTVRVLPSHPLLSNPLKLGLVHWAEPVKP